MWSRQRCTIFYPLLTISLGANQQLTRQYIPAVNGVRSQPCEPQCPPEVILTPTKVHTEAAPPAAPGALARSSSGHSKPLCTWPQDPLTGRSTARVTCLPPALSFSTVDQVTTKQGMKHSSHLLRSLRTEFPRGAPPQEHPHRHVTHASTKCAVSCQIQFKGVKKPPTCARAAQVSSAEWRSQHPPWQTHHHTRHTFGIRVGRERGDGRPSSNVALWRGSGRRGGGRPGWVCAGESHRAALGLLAVLHGLEQPTCVRTGRQHRCSGPGGGLPRAAAEQLATLSMRQWPPCLPSGVILLQ